MTNFFWQRLLQLPLVLFGVSLLVFLLVYNLPGDPSLLLLPPEASPSERQMLLTSLGLKDPLAVKYVKWLEQLLHGNLGYSLTYQQQVAPLLLRRLTNTLLLSLSALLLSMLLALILGVLAAVSYQSFLDHLLTFLAFLGLSTPAFFLSLLLLRFVAFDWGWLPVSGLNSASDGRLGLWSILPYMVLPVCVLAFLQAARYMRYIRSTMLTILAQDYIRYAYARGFSRLRVVWRHALRNAAIPIVTLFNLSLGSMFSGALLVETVFDWPGMGRLMYESIFSRDYPVLIGGTMFFALMTSLASLVADLCYVVIDPRLRYD